MTDLDLSKIANLNTQNLSMSSLNMIIDNLTMDNVRTSFTGKRSIILRQQTYTLQNPHPFCKTSFEALSKAIVDNLQKYPISQMSNVKNFSFWDKLDLTHKVELEKHKKEIELSKSVLKKLNTLEKLSKEQIKKSNIITRVFFFFTNFFNNIFSYNLKNASKYIAIHEDIISKKEIVLKPFAKYQKINAIFSTSIGLMFYANLFLQLFGIKDIPYVSKALNAVTIITIIKIAYSQISNAVNHPFLKERA